MRAGPRDAVGAMRRARGGDVNRTYLFMDEVEDKLDRARIYDGTATAESDEVPCDDTEGMRCLCDHAWMRETCFIKVSACEWTP